jgi:hypothetical protein
LKGNATGAADSGLASDLVESDDGFFEAGIPGSLKVGFMFMSGLELGVGGIAFFATLEERIRSGTEGSLKPGVGASRGTLDDVKSRATRIGYCVRWNGYW